MPATRHRRRDGGSARRLFGVYAAVSLVPVLALAGVLLVTLHGNGDEQGLAEARATSALVARSLVAPQLVQDDLTGGLTTAERRRLSTVVQSAISDGAVLRLRVRDSDGVVVFSDDGSGLGGVADDETAEAAAGTVVAELTQLNDDEGDSGPAGPEVVEIYRPLLSAGAQEQIGVLEVYVPYAPIADHIAAQRRGVVAVLAVGLGGLWLVLLLVSASTTRRLRRQLERTRYLAEHDQLTGLPNRASFVRAVTERLADGGAAVVAVLDLDGFGQVNDVLGHENGDALLQQLAGRLADSVGAAEVLARLGGDEFGVVLPAGPGDTPAGARLAELRRAVAAPVTVDGIPIVVPAVVGYAVSPDDGVSPVALLRHADVAVHTAAEQQLDIVRYRSEQETHDAAALALIGELRQAVADDQLVLHYQPKGDLGSREVHGVEALIRWQHPVRGLLFPDSFIPLAERTELIDDVLWWVVRHAARELRAFPDLAVAVNVSARSLSRPATADSLLALLAEEGLPACRVVVEITETALMSDPVAAEATLRRLHEAGVRSSIDDFGAGQTGLGRLATLPVSELKVDKSFVMPMAPGSRESAIVRSVIELGHNLGCRVTAEGVETAAILDQLGALGCDTAQGYLLARPVPLAGLAAALAGARTALRQSADAVLTR